MFHFTAVPKDEEMSFCAGLPGKYPTDDAKYLAKKQEQPPRKRITRHQQRATNLEKTDRCLFLTKLPLEVREMIYTELLTCNTSAKQPDKKGYLELIDTNRGRPPLVKDASLLLVDHRVTTAILLANRQIHTEANPVLLRRNLFVCVNSSVGMGRILAACCVPVLAAGKVAKQFPHHGLRLVVASPPRKWLTSYWLMLAAHLPLLTDALTTILPPINTAGRNESTGGIFTVRRSLLRTQTVPDILRLIQLPGASVNLAQQAQILASFRTDYPGLRKLQMSGDWNADLREAAEHDIHHTLQFGDRIPSGHPERTACFLELAKAYFHNHQTRTALRYLGLAHSRLFANGADRLIVTDWRHNRRRLELNYVVFVYLAATAFELRGQSSYTIMQHRESARLVTYLDTWAKVMMKEVAQMIKPAEEEVIVEMMGRWTGFERLLYAVGLWRNPVLRDSAVREWGVHGEVPAAWRLE